MRARPVLAATAILASVTLAGCGSRVGSEVGSDGLGGSPATAGAATVGAAGAGNVASDRGVTATTIKIGVIVGKSSPLGPDTFSGSLYGAQAYFDTINAAGGIHGRKVKVIACDDGGSGQQNNACVHKLIDDDKVFALAGTTALTYAGAPYASRKDVPDIGGQPIDNSYDTYPHLYSIVGGDYPRNGSSAGFGGNLTGGTEVYRYFKEKLGTHTAAVVYYNVAQSQRYAQSIEKGLRAEGYSVIDEQVNLALGNFDAVALDMKSKNVDSVYDAMDDGGNGKLCAAMDTHGVSVKAKVTTSQGWTDAVGTTYAKSPACRNSLYATDGMLSYDDTKYPAVKAFRDAIAKYEPSRETHLNDWTLTGYASAQWFSDAATSCGANLNRGCLEAYMNRTTDYDGHGLLTPRNFTHATAPPATQRNCTNVVRWQDSANGGKGGWVTQVANMDTNCFTVPMVSYPAS